MGHPGPRRVLVTFRIATTGLEQLDAAAKRLGVKRSELIRRLIKDGLTKLPR